jgi:NADP-dependent 3-hydroxy acid dehydrogenase YdfG
MNKLEHKNIIVIGASGGIGSALVRSFCKEGASITLVARTKDKLEQLSQTLGCENLVFPADAADPVQIELAFKKTQEVFGSVDAVVIAAGTWKQLSIDADINEAISLSDQHYKSLFMPTFITGYIAQQFFRKQGHGLLFNISSHAAVRPELSANLTYGPMKAASRHFIQSLFYELKGTSVRVADLQPAIVNTPDAAAMLDTPEKQMQAVQPEDIAAWIIDNFNNPELPKEKLFDSNLVV